MMCKNRGILLGNGAKDGTKRGQAGKRNYSGI